MMGFPSLKSLFERYTIFIRELPGEKVLGLIVVKHTHALLSTFKAFIFGY